MTEEEKRKVLRYIEENDCEVKATGEEAKRIVRLEVFTDGIPLDRLEQLMQAERDGRCVVLHSAQQPSKDGEEKPMCFYTDKPGREFCMAYCNGEWDDEPIDACKECWFCDGNDDFREASQAALEGGAK